MMISRSEIEELRLCAHETDRFEALGEEALLRLQIGDPDVRTFARHRDGKLVAFAQAVRYPERTVAEVLVAPRWRRRGLATALLAELQQTSAAPVHLWAPGRSAWAGGRPGWTAVRSLLKMRAPLPCRQGAPIGIRHFKPGQDEASWLVLHQRVFANHIDNSHWQLRDLKLRMDACWFAAEHFWLVEQEGCLIGYLWLKHNEIYQLGVCPLHRRRGLARKLCQQALQFLGEHGQESCFLYTDEDNLEARRLYHGLGFEQEERRLLFALPAVQGVPQLACQTSSQGQFQQGGPVHSGHRFHTQILD